MPSMIGRTAEFAMLVRALERALDGQSAVALIGGEAGIGKTTLATELRSAAEARRFAIRWGRTPEAAWAGPFAPWIEALVMADGNASTLFETPGISTPEERETRIHEHVLTHLRGIVAHQATLLVLEDLHWAQPATLDLLRHVAFDFGRSSLLIAVTYRASAAAPHLPLGKTAGHLRHEAQVLDIQLTGLDCTELAALLRLPQQDDVEQILRVTKGNPLFAIEIGRALTHDRSPHGALKTTGLTGEHEVPLAVSQAIALQMDHLSQPAQQVLSFGSIFAEGFDVSTISTLTKLPEKDVIDALDEATIAGLIEAGRGLDEFVFAHAIVRHAVLGSWQSSRLIRERRRAAELLAAHPRAHQAGEIASLYHASRSLPGASAGAEFAVEAAISARKAGSPEQTADFLSMALDLLEYDDARQTGILCELAVAQAEAFRIETAVECGWRAIDAMTAASATGSEIAEFCAEMAIALKNRAGAAVDQWSPFVTFGLERVPDRGRGWARLSLILDPVEPISRNGVRAGIWKGFDPEAIAIARSDGTEEDRARSFESFDNRSRSETDQLLALARGFRTLRARLHVLTVAANDLQYRHGAFRDALVVWNDIAALAEKHGAVAWQAQALNQRALAELALGEFPQAEDSENAANNLLRRLGPGRHPELFSMEMATARASYLGGDYAKLAEFWLAFADNPALGPGEPASLLGPFFAAVGVFAATEAGLTDRARSTLAILTPLLERLPLDAPNHNGAVAFGALAMWNLREQRLAAVYRSLLRRMLDSDIQDYPQTSLALSLARIEALFDHSEEAESAFTLAHNQLERSGQIPLLAIARYDHAVWISERGHPDLVRATVLATDAAAQFEHLRMHPWHDRATQLIAAIEQKAGPATYPAGLTQREVDVLALAVQGHSDKEISDLLFISPRTVNAHMRNMFAKTSSANRTELSVWAVAQGIVAR